MKRTGLATPVHEWSTDPRETRVRELSVVLRPVTTVVVPGRGGLVLLPTPGPQAGLGNRQSGPIRCLLEMLDLETPVLGVQ